MIKAINAAAGKRKHTLVLFCSFQQVSFLTEALATQGYLFEVALWAHKGSKSASSGKSGQFFFAQEYMFMWSAFKGTFQMAQPFIVGHFTGGGKDEIYLPEGTSNMFQTNGMALPLQKVLRDNLWSS